MRFTRFPRYEPVVMTPRRQSAFVRKQANERARYPLFPDAIASEQIDMQTEHDRRQVRRDSSEVRMRDLHARVWREARALYFSQPDDVRADIRATWATWTGPTTAFYFSSIVDVKSGEQERRVARMQEEIRPLIEAERARRRSGVSLPLFR